MLLDRFGCALLLDCHSMPPPPTGVPPIVFGDCRGRTADAWVSARGAGDRPSAAGFEAGLNDPFAGGHVIERHARPARGVHALQIEIDRRCYLDATLTRARHRLRPRRGVASKRSPSSSAKRCSAGSSRPPPSSAP